MQGFKSYFISIFYDLFISNDTRNISFRFEKVLLILRALFKAFFFPFQTMISDWLSTLCSTISKK